MSKKQKHFIPGNRQVQQLLRPLSIAIIGATDGESKAGGMITKSLLTGDYGGRVVAVNPHRQSVFGAPCFLTLGDAPEPHVDCVIIAVPARLVCDVVRESIQYAKNFVVIAAGFGESDEEGKKREQELQDLADEHQLAILGPNCLGFVSPHAHINASFAPHILTQGNVALLSQSGALAVALLDQSVVTNQGFSFVISLGNKMQIDESVLMQFLAQDDATDVIALYLESISDGVRFVQAIEAVGDIKPIILLKGGTTDAGQKAMASHTGALMQEGAVLEAFCEKHGIVLVDSFGALSDAVQYARQYGTRALQKTAIVTNAGGLGVLATDACTQFGVPLAEPSHDTRIALGEILPSAASVENPIDILGDAGLGRYQDTFDILQKDSGIDTVLTILTPQAQTPVQAIATEIVQRVHDDTMIHVTSFVGGMRTRDAVQYLSRSGVVHVDRPEDGARLIAHMQKRVVAQYGCTQYGRKAERVAEGDKIIARVYAEERPSLFYTEVASLAQTYNIPLVSAWRMDYDSPSSVTFPCVVKIDAPSILHKTDQRAVFVGVRDGTALNEAIADLQERFSGERVIVQPMLPSGTELIIGAKRDAVFGPTILVGYGGIYTEEINMTELLLPPFSSGDAMERLRTSRLSFLFRQTRGQSPYDIAAVAHIITSLGEMMLEQEWIAEIDINPLFIYNDGKSPVAVDFKIIVRGDKEK